MYGQKVAATYSYLAFTIEPVPAEPDSVKLSLRLRRQLKNHSHEEVRYPAGALFDLEEWCHKQGPSVIERAEIRRNNKPWIQIPKMTLTEKGRWEARIEKELSFEGDETLDVLCDGYEFKAVNDHYIMVFRTALNRSEV